MLGSKKDDNCNQLKTLASGQLDLRRDSSYVEAVLRYEKRYVCYTVMPKIAALE